MESGLSLPICQTDKLWAGLICFDYTSQKVDIQACVTWVLAAELSSPIEVLVSLE